MEDSVFWVMFGLLAVPFTLVGLLLGAVGGYVFLQRWWLTLFGQRAIGTVVGHVGSKKTVGPDGEISELAVSSPYLRIKFVDCFGKEHKVSSDTGASPKKFPKGSDVSLLYRARRPRTFVVDNFWLKWFGPVAFLGMGLTMSVPGFVVLGVVWPAFGKTSQRLLNQTAPWLFPPLFLGLASSFALFGAFLIRDRLRRLRHNDRTTGQIIAVGSRGSGDSTYQWIRVAYTDAKGNPLEQTLTVVTGVASPTRTVGQSVRLLVDPESPLDVLLNEPLELWFVPAMFAVLGTIVVVALTWGWGTGGFH